MPIALLPYNEARKLILTGDLGLCRSSSILGKAIDHFSDALGIDRYSHATVFGYAGNCLMIGETREHADARLIAASAEIQKFPGYYDVYRALLWEDIYHELPWKVDNYLCNAQRSAVWGFICRAGGAKYSMRHLAKAWARRRLPFGKTLVSPFPNSNDPQYPRNCSALVHAAFRSCGVLEISKFDCDVVPGDLTDPLYFRYLFTLIWAKSAETTML